MAADQGSVAVTPTTGQGPVSRVARDTFPEDPARHPPAPPDARPDNDDMGKRHAARARVALALLGVLMAVVGFWLAWQPGHRDLAGLVRDNTLNNAANGLWISALAAVLLCLRPGNRIGWLILVVGLANSVTMFGTGWALASFRMDLPARAWLAWGGSWPWAPAFLLGSSLVLLIYPSGHTSSRFGHRLAVASLVSACGLALGMGLLDAPFDTVAPGHDLGHNPVSHGLLQTPLLWLTIASAALGVLVALLTWGYTARRLWRSRSPEREQLAWLAVAVVPTLAVAPLNSPWVEFAVNLITTAALGIGIVRYRLFDIKMVLRSGLVYGSLTALSVATYFAVVAAITSITPRGPVPTLFAVADVGLLVVPAHQLLQRFFSRLVYGDRADPIRALTRVGQGIRTAGAEGMVPMLTGIASALRSPHVAIRGPDGIVVAEAGIDAAGHPEHAVPLEYAGVHVGDLLVAGRTERNRLGRADRQLVAALAGPVAAAVHADRTARELANSRERVIAVRESERTRLRADLHDGLGPSLSGISLGLEAAIGAVATGPERVPDILGVLHHEVVSLVEEVRTIIDDLGPQGEDLDVLPVLRRQVDAVRAGGIAVELRHEGRIRASSSVALAVQRIAGEALTNAVRHAAATRITVAVLDRAEQLVIEVVDDGCGVLAPRAGGLGLTSMRQRAEAVGGRLTLEAAPGRGTVVRAVLPTGTA